MKIKNVLVLAAVASALLVDASAASAEGLGVGLNVGPIGAHVGIGTGTGYFPRAGFYHQGLPLVLNQSAVFNGGITTVGPGLNTNVVVLPAGAKLVTGVPVGETAIILPGMIGLPDVCGQVVGSNFPSATSLISQTETPVAELGPNPMPTAAPLVHKTVAIRTIVHHKRFLRCMPKHHVKRRLIKCERILK